MADLSLERDQHYKVQGPPDIVKMNQLQNLIHDALISTGHVQHCALVRRKDCSIQATSVGFSLNAEQLHMLLDAFRTPPQTREEGIFFEDKLYKCVRADKSSIYAKQQSKGLVLVKTNTLLVVATYSENMYPSVCVEAVEKLADYFREKGK
ncbi:profilin-4-like isoform X2 [Liolophura sinensis]|uniref:profilin-4-like isoform X2 n=1 Tax=Liolophura sinensis TaxID=3198878 RepID=UPI003158E8EE